jgi:23S rRNA pseudouridine1911/1915/1917 synthase
MAVVSESAGRHAVTHYEVLEVLGGTAKEPVASLLRVTLETGRTHQVRVHLAHIGHPLLGDMVYGSGFKTSANKLTADAQAALAALDRQALHAAELGFEHPTSGKRLSFTSKLPADMASLVEALESATPPVRGLDGRQGSLKRRPEKSRRR